MKEGCSAAGTGGLYGGQTKERLPTSSLSKKFDSSQGMLETF